MPSLIQFHKKSEDKTKRNPRFWKLLLIGIKSNYPDLNCLQSVICDPMGSVYPEMLVCMKIVSIHNTNRSKLTHHVWHKLRSIHRRDPFRSHGQNGRPSGAKAEAQEHPHSDNPAEAGGCCAGSQQREEAGQERAVAEDSSGGENGKHYNIISGLFIFSHNVTIKISLVLIKCLRISPHIRNEVKILLDS